MATLAKRMCTEVPPHGGDGPAVARLPKRVKEPTVPHRLHHTFADDAGGADALSAAVTETMCLWEIRWCAQSAEHVASTLANWLLRTGHRIHDHDGHLSLHVSYEPERRQLTIVLRDGGHTLPSLTVDDDLRRNLGVPGAFIYAHRVDGAGREITVVMKARSAWRVRLTWDRDSFEGRHPLHSHESHDSEQAAVAAAEAASLLIHRGDAGGQLVAVDLQGPDDADNKWTPYSDLDVSCPEVDQEDAR